LTVSVLAFILAVRALAVSVLAFGALAVRASASGALAFILAFNILAFILAFNILAFDALAFNVLVGHREKYSQKGGG